MAQEGAAFSPENYLRDLVAGKHAAGAEIVAPVAKPGLLGRILGFLRSTGAEPVK